MGESLHYTELVSGSVLKSYHIDGLPDSDDINVFGNCINGRIYFFKEF